MKFDKKAFLPHAIAVAIFFVLSAVYFYPVFQGNTLYMGDLVSHKGMSKEIVDLRTYEDTEVLWTNSMFGGMPGYHISHINETNIIGFVGKLKKVFPRPPFYFLVMMLSFYVLASALKIKPLVRIVGAVAFAFSTFFIISMGAGHASKIHAISYMPLILAGAIFILNDKYIKGLIVFAIGLSLQIKANHIQITYYTMMISLIYVAFRIIERVKLKEIKELTICGLIFLGGIALAVGTNATNLLLTYEYSKSTTRGTSELTISPNGEVKNNRNTGGLDAAYITNWSLGIEESLSFIIPNAKGGASGRLGDAHPESLKKASSQYRTTLGQSFSSYWGNQPFTAGPTYIGAVIFFLFVLGMVILKDRIKWPFFIAIILSLFLGWGHNFMAFSDFFIDYIPMYNKFRTVTMALVILMFLIPVIAVMFLNKIIEDEAFLEENKKKILVTSGVFVSIVLALIALPDSFLTFVSAKESDSIAAQIQSNPNAASQLETLLSELKVVRQGIFRGDGLRAILLIVLTLGAIMAFSLKKVKWEVLIIVIAVIGVFDIWSVDKRYLNNEKVRGKYTRWVKPEKFDRPYTPKPYDIQILNAEKRAIPDFDQKVKDWMDKSSSKKVSEAEKVAISFGVLNANSNYRVLNLAENTFNSSQTSYFHKSAGGYHPAKLMRYQDLIDFYINRSTGTINPRVLGMLNTKYIVTSENGGAVQGNPNVLGNAWFVDKLIPVENADEEILKIGKINLSNEATIENKFLASDKPLTYSTNGAQIKMESYHPDRITYSSSASSSQYAVFSEVYYQPGWNAYINGKLVAHDRVNYTLRGVLVPQGDNTIEFRFEPSSLGLGNVVAYTSSGLLILMVLVGAFKFKSN